MVKIRMVFVVTIAVLLVATPALSTEGFNPEFLDGGNKKVPIYIINARNDIWQVKVWAYSGGAKSPELYSCQTIHYTSERMAIIRPDTASGLAELWRNHCGNYDSVTLWFQTYNTVTGVTLDYSTFGEPTPWGATWTWDGNRWTCSGC